MCLIKLQKVTIYSQIKELIKIKGSIAKECPTAFLKNIEIIDITRSRKSESKRVPKKAK